VIALPWIVCSSTTGCYESKVTDNYFQDRLHLHHRPIAIKARSSRTAGLFSRSSASPTDCYQSKINCFSSTGRLLLEQGHQEQQDHSQGRLHQHHRSIAIEARPSASAAPADCYRSKVIKNSITGRLLSKQGQLLQQHRPITIEARSSRTAGPFSRSSASASPVDCYRSKAICFSSIGRLLSKQGHQEQHHRPIAVKARSIAFSSTGRLLSKQGYQEQQDHSQGRLRLHHRPIAIKARSSASASPADCYRSKAICSSSTGRLLSKQGHRQSSSRSSTSAPPTDCYHSKVIGNSRIILKVVCTIDRVLLEQG